MILGYEEFASEFMEALKDIMPDAELERVSVEKVNGTKDAVRLQLPEYKNVVPAIYLDELYQSYQRGASPDIIAERVSHSICIDAAQFQEAANINKEHVAERLFPCAINKEWNKNILENTPHKDIEGTDLTMIARYKVQDNGEQRTSFIVTQDNASALGMTADEALKQATANGAKDIYECKGLTESLDVEFGKMGVQGASYTGFQSPKKDIAYILSNKNYHQGAVVLGYPDQIKEGLKRINEKACYILPSSTHEVILVPESLGEDKTKQLTNMVKSVNSEVVASEEQLSNHVYFFDGNCLSIADTQALNKEMPKSQGTGKKPSMDTKKHERSKGPVR